MLDDFLKMMDVDWREESVQISVGDEWKWIDVSDCDGKNRFRLTADWMNKWEKNRVELVALRLMTIPVKEIDKMLKKSDIKVYYMNVPL